MGVNVGRETLDGSLHDSRTLAEDPCRWRRQLLGFVLVSIAILGLSAGGHTYSIDEELMVAQTGALVNGRADISYYEPSVDSLFYTQSDGDHVPVYGIGQSVVGAPLYVAARALSFLGGDSDVSVTMYTGVLFANTIITALTALVVALLCRQLGASTRGSIALAAMYAFCTFAFPHASTYGSEPGAALFTALAVLLAARSRSQQMSWRLIALSSAATGTAALFRISCLAFVPLICLYLVAPSLNLVARQFEPRRFMSYSAAVLTGLSLPIGLLAVTNAWRYGSPFNVGYRDSGTGYPLLRGLINIFFSPGKSLLLFAPILIPILAGIIVYRRHLTSIHMLIGSLIAVNTVIISRLAIWSGDAAWGPRYMLVVLPLGVVLGHVVVDRIRWRRYLTASAIVGLVLPGLIGVLVYFNVFFIDAIDKLGTAPVSSEAGTPEAVVKIRHDLEWNQILGSAKLLPEAFADVFRRGGDGTSARPPYLPWPSSHYRYFGDHPRIDLWWLWVEPTGANKVTYVYFVPLLSFGALGLYFLRRHGVDG